MSKNKGFTVIELILVVAIIAVLTLVIIAGFSVVRQRNANAAIKSSLNQARTQADIFYTTGNTYAGVCSSVSDSLSNSGIYGMVLSAAKLSGLTSITVNGTGAVGRATCNTTALNWAAEVPLKGSNNFWCVDSSRKGLVESVSIGSGVACP